MSGIRASLGVGARNHHRGVDLGLMATFDAVLLDLDQTLVDTKESILAAFVHTFRTELQRELHPDEVLAIYGRPLREQMRTLAGEERADGLVASYRRYFDQVESLIKPYPAWPGVLAELRTRGIETAVVTSKGARFARRHLELHGLHVLVDVVVALEDTTEHKPHPEPCLRAAALLGVDPRRCLMVGDSPWDILAGQRAGMKAALAKWGLYDPEAFRREGAVPDTTLETPEQLLTFLPAEAGS
ncbi:MAG: HAD-IA family hydrolase [Bacillota bacterium]|nr:HAD-IA family hydrolase [Bacillota bacterium]